VFLQTAVIKDCQDDINVEGTVDMYMSYAGSKTH